MTPSHDGGAARQQPPTSNLAQTINRPHLTTPVRQTPRATRVRAVVRCDLSGLVDGTGMLDDREARVRLCQVADDTEPGQALVIDLGSASYSMPCTFYDAAEYLADVGAVQVQGTHGAFVREVAEQLDEALR